MKRLLHPNILRWLPLEHAGFGLNFHTMDSRGMAPGREKSLEEMTAEAEATPRFRERLGFLHAALTGGVVLASLLLMEHLVVDLEKTMGYWPLRMLSTVFVTGAAVVAALALQKSRNELEARVTRRTEQLASTLETLRLSEQRFRDLVETCSDWIWEVDPKGKFTFSSPRAREVLGRRPEDLILKSPCEFILEEDRQRFQEFLQMAPQRPMVPTHFEFAVVRSDGRPVRLETTGMAVFDQQGSLIAFRGCSRDITERKRAEHQREQLIKKLQQTLTELKTLSGLLPICAACKKIRDDKGYWQSLEAYFAHHASVTFTHGICPDCMQRLYKRPSPERNGRLAPE